MFFKKEKKINDYFFFFFKQKTAYEIYQCDWSSDVCSSDLGDWKWDLSEVSKYDFPQAQLLNVGERGMREHLPAKTIERECGLVQLETARIVDSFLKKYGEKVPSMNALANPACVIEGGCKKGGCTFGAEKYLDRLV